MSVESRSFAAHRSSYPFSSSVAALLMVAAMFFAFAKPLAAQQAIPKLGHTLTELPDPKNAPVFRLQDMDEDAHSLDDYRGKVILLNFWATWCPPCRREIPSMERLYQMLKDQGFTVLAVNQWEDPDPVFAYTGQPARRLARYVAYG